MSENHNVVFINAIFFESALMTILISFNKLLYFFLKTVDINYFFYNQHSFEVRTLL